MKSMAFEQCGRQQSREERNADLATGRTGQDMDAQPLVEIVEDDACPGCYYKKALRYLLKHAVGTGRLTLGADELAELDEPDLLMLILRFKEE